MTKAGHTGILVDILDADGHEMGRSTVVLLDYVVDIDKSYGEDADGNRGTTLVEYMVLDKWIEKEDLLTLNSAQVEQALADAEAIFHRAEKHYL